MLNKRLRVAYTSFEGFWLTSFKFTVFTVSGFQRVTESYDNWDIALSAMKTKKLVSGHAHNSLIHISSLICHVVFRGLVVIAIASHLTCFLQDGEILRTRSQSATRKNNKNKKDSSPKTESKLFNKLMSVFMRLSSY